MGFPSASWDIRDPRVLTAIGEVDRSAFLANEQRAWADEDRPLPIGCGQTISQPYIVAYMSEALEVGKGMKVLELGTGSGYQAAVLARLGARVYTVERIGELAQSAAERLGRLGYDTIEVRHGDGSLGWPEEAPFDRIVVTAALRRLPRVLIDQLLPGGRIVYPVGGRRVQQLTLLVKDRGGEAHTHSLLPVCFVPFLPGRV